MKTAIRALSGACTLGLFLTLVSSTVFAQTPEERAGARNAARSGLQSYEAGKYADALDLFSRAENLVHAPTHLLYIARANVKLGRLVRAQEAYQQLIREKLAASAPQPFREAQQSAEQELAAFESRIPTITIKVTGEDTTQVQVTMDGKPLSASLVGIPCPADPGSHKFAASAPGFAAATVEKTLAEGGREQVELKLVPSANSPATKPTTPSAPTSGDQTGPTATGVNLAATPEDKPSNKVLAYTALGVGAVGIGAGIFFVVGRANANADASDQYDACQVQPNGCSPRQQSKIDDLDSTAETDGWLSIISFSVGGLAAATGITLLVLDSGSPSKPAAAQHTNLRVWAGPGSLGLAGQF